MYAVSPPFDVNDFPIVKLFYSESVNVPTEFPIHIQSCPVINAAAVF